MLKKEIKGEDLWLEFRDGFCEVSLIIKEMGINVKQVKGYNYKGQVCKQ